MNRSAVLVLVASSVLPRLIDRMTPNIDEEKEIVRGNQAVAEYLREESLKASNRKKNPWSGPIIVGYDRRFQSESFAREIAKVIKDRPWLKDRKPLKLAAQWRAVEVTGDLCLPGSGAPVEKHPARFVGVGEAEGNLEPLADDRAGPVVLLGALHICEQGYQQVNDTLE